ncbi:MAG: response regulator [Acidobacteriota bacterium]
MSASRSDRAAPGEPGAEKLARILLVEDVRRLVELMKNYLKRTTCRILTARNGAEAIRICRHEMPDVVFLDAAMQEMSGIEVCRTLKADPALRSIPVVLVATRDRAEECRAAGCDDVLGKPVVQEEFLTRVRRFVALHERSEERIPVSLRVEIRTRGGTLACYTKDLSLHGAFLKAGGSLAVGARLRLALHLPRDRGTIELEGEVRRIVRPTAGSHLLPGAGVRFLSVPPAARQALREFIDERLGR